MKQLVAARPILYMGRMYESGDAVPAYDGKMVAAWLAAGSVKWAGTDADKPESVKTETIELKKATARPVKNGGARK